MSEKFPTPFERKKNTFESLLRIVRKTIIVSMMGFAATQSSASEKPTDIYSGHPETKIEALKANSELKKISLEDIQNMITHDEFERMLLGNTDALYEAGNGYEESGHIKFEDIQKVIDQGEKSPIIGHTHPLSVYNNVGYTSEDIEAMRREASLRAPMPPSITDIMGSINTDTHFNPQGVEIREQVYDPTGTWEYSIQTSNSSIQIFNQFQVDFLENINTSLSESDHELLKASNLKDQHPGKIIAVLKSNAETSLLGNKIEATATSYLDNLPEEQGEVLSKLEELEILGSEIASSKKSEKTSEEVRILLNTYMELAQDIGIQISYEPHQRN
jgi:hypothetical protein